MTKTTKLLSLLPPVAAAFLPQAQCEILHTKEEAFKLAFPSADRVESKDLFIGSKSVTKIETLLQQKVKSRLLRYYVGIIDGKQHALAFVDSRIVRTLPATVMTVINMQGAVEGVHLVSFFEPKEYRPSESWLTRFQKLHGTNESLPNNIDGIAGSTLTSDSIKSSVNQSLAYFEVLFAKPQATREKPKQ